MRNSVRTILGFVTSCLVVQPSDPPSPTELALPLGSCSTDYRWLPRTTWAKSHGTGGGGGWNQSVQRGVSWISSPASLWLSIFCCLENQASRMVFFVVQRRSNLVCVSLKAVIPFGAYTPGAEWLWQNSCFFLGSVVKSWGGGANSELNLMSFHIIIWMRSYAIMSYP